MGSTRNWIDSAQVRDYCRVLVNVSFIPEVIAFQLDYNEMLTERIISFQF
jgi:hypothetical protein